MYKKTDYQYNNKCQSNNKYTF